MKFKVKNKYVFFLNILISFLLILQVILKWNLLPYNWSLTITIEVFLLLIYHLISLKIMEYKFSDFLTIFIILNYLFLFGRIILNAFNADEEIFWKLFDFYSQEACYKAALFCICYIQLFFHGATSIKQNIEQNDEEIKRKEKKYNNSTILFIGIMILLITMPFKIMYDLKTIAAQSINNSYVASAANVDGVTASMANLTIVGLIFIIFSNKVKKNNMLLILIIYFTYATIPMILAGDRRQFVISFIVCAIAFIKKYNIKIGIIQILLGISVAILGLFVLKAIRVGRALVITDFSSFLDLLKQSLNESNIIYETLAEFGITFFSVASVVDFYPQKFLFLYGKGYILALIIIIPKMAELFPNISSVGLISKQIKSIFGHGLGGSIPQDLYANFGVLGICLMPLIGKILVKLTKTYKNPTNIDLALYYINFYLLINMVRTSVTDMTRLFAYSYLMIWFFRKVSNRNL